MGRRVAELLAPYSVHVLKQGTVRFGFDPAKSVLDRNCRAHGLSNLYVTDASICPSSGGTNPSLTIAANALRVAAAMLADARTHQRCETPDFTCHSH